MFHKVKSVKPLDDFLLQVRFVEGVTKVYDVKPLFDVWEVFQTFKEEPGLFKKVEVVPDGCGIVWNDEIDLSCEDLFEFGKTVQTPFDGLIAFSDASKLWNLNESTLRKAVTYGKLIEDVDACKFGKQWLVSTKAMEREYGPIA